MAWQFLQKNDINKIFLFDKIKMTTIESKHPLPWIEKHRPKTLDDVIDYTDKIATLKNMIKTGELPNLLFYGPAGAGKTSTILACARAIYGENYRSFCYELNDSDERGIETVRNNITNFAKKDIRGRFPFKLIILDEVDGVTEIAQEALRVVIESHKTTRFCLICNNVNKVHEGLQSRCVKIKFKKLPSEVSFKKIRSIADAEGVNIDDNMLNYLLNLDKDFRQIIGTLQSLSSTRESSKITREDINDCLGIPDDNDIYFFLNTMKTKPLKSALTIILDKHKDNEYNICEFLDALSKKLCNTLDDYTDEQLIKIFNKMSDVKFKVSDGYDCEVYLLALVTSFY